MRHTFHANWFHRGLLATVCLAVLSQLLVGPALALTCPYPERSVERMFASHDGSPGTYFIAYGTLVPTEPMPAFDHDTQGRAPFNARFEGHLARPSGFDIRAAFEVTVRSSCIYHDACGSVPTGPDPALMFIRQEEGQFVFRATPCNDDLLFSPTEGELSRAIACQDGKKCVAP